MTSSLFLLSKVNKDAKVREKIFDGLFSNCAWTKVSGSREETLLRNPCYDEEEQVIKNIKTSSKILGVEQNFMFRQLLSTPREEAATLMEQRFPVPQYVVCDQARFLMSKVNHSLSAHNHTNRNPSNIVHTSSKEDNK